MEACPLKNLSLAPEAVDDENMNVQYLAFESVHAL
jgi:hypothetical protein